MERVAGAGLAVALLAGGVGCGLSTDNSVWRAEIAEGDGGAAVTFCPVTGLQGTPAGSFVPDTTAAVVLSDVDEDVYTFSQLGSQTGSLSTAMSELFGGQMAFDLGPIGLAYDDSPPLQLTVGGVSVARTFVEGQRRSDDEVELRYEYAPVCEQVTLGDGGTCDCASRTLTWRFTGGS
jgi:hypothetical protein